MCHVEGVPVEAGRSATLRQVSQFTKKRSSFLGRTKNREDALNVKAAQSIRIKACEVAAHVNTFSWLLGKRDDPSHSRRILAYENGHGLHHRDK